MLSDVIDLVDEEAVLANDAFLTREAVSQYVNNPDKGDKKKKCRDFLVGAGLRGLFYLPKRDN